MFIQIIQGKSTRQDECREMGERWLRELAPGANGWLGGTYGFTDDDQFLAIVRFESQEAAAANAARRNRIRHRLVILAAVGFGLAEIVAGSMPSYAAFAVWTPVLGIASLTMITSANATFQMSVAPEMRGRVMALYMMIFMGGTPVGAPIVGWVGQTFGARWTLIGGGVATILGTAPG